MPENQNQSAEPSFEEILQFDPFGGEAEGGQEGDGGTTPPTPATPPAETGEDTAGGKGTAPPPAAAPAPPPPPKPITQEDLTSAMMRQADAIARAVTPAPQPQQPQQQQPRFNMGIPDELVTALRSEDSGQFKAGVGALVNSLANHIWQNFQHDVAQTLVPAIRQMIETHTSNTSQQESVGRDFYGTYPELNNPQLMPLVQTVGAQLAREAAQAGRSLDWSPQLRDEIANRVFAIVSAVQARGQGAAPPARRQPFVANGGARPPQAGPSTFDEMQAMVFGKG